MAVRHHVIAETFLTAWRRIDDVPAGEAARSAPVDGGGDRSGLRSMASAAGLSRSQGFSRDVGVSARGNSGGVGGTTFRSGKWFWLL
jgi:hypothetical protein